jgi:simple sugar transport system substrate-binding protein
LGGDPGDQFSAVIYKGCLDAQAQFGCKVDYVYSGWSNERMMSQFRDAIAARPDGIAMMGHPGDDALMPLVEEAYKKGILVVFVNVDVPKVRARFGCGYVGANLYDFGHAMVDYSIKKLNLKKGDRAAIFGVWTEPAQAIREEAGAKAFEEAGIIVDRLERTPPMATDPMMALPALTGEVKNHPDVKVIHYGGVQLLSSAPAYMEALNKKPGEIAAIGFDMSPALIDAFKKGYVQVSGDQLPYLQGYYPIQMLCFQKKYGMPGLKIDTGAGIVDDKNYMDVAGLANDKIR